MTTLAEHIIVARAQNCPPMLEKSMYGSWESRIRLFIKGKKHGLEMKLEFQSIMTIIFLNVEENGKLRLKNTLNSLKHNNFKMIVMFKQQSFFMISTRCVKPVLVCYYWRFFTAHNRHAYYCFSSGEDLIECINKVMAFLSAVALRFPPQTINLKHRLILEIKQPFKTAESLFNKFKEDKFRVMLVQETEELLLLQREMLTRNVAWFKEKLMLAEAREAGQILDEEQLAFLADPGIAKSFSCLQSDNPDRINVFQTDNLDAYDSDCADLSSAKAVLMANLSSYDPEVLSEVAYSESYPNDMINQDVKEMHYSE
ncbi:hypothetical protein Tco_1091178 [Tanacetum coccineum]|uniref:Uncharacterized protein n=1 Tax=Tanacetum coccineum TaxID=301880 RepID=A0ABQ5I6D3_9ASTR